MTRREWLQKNPPPKVGAYIRELLEQAVQENNTRALLEANKVTFGEHIKYWTQQAQNARATADTITLNHANTQLAEVEKKIQEIEKQLAVTANVSTRVAQLKQELNLAARCPTHQTDLLRHKNRPDDLFLCEIGPHFFLWTKVGTAAQLSPVDLAKPMPGLDDTMEWL